MTDWSLYYKRLNTKGSTKRERDLNCIKQNLTNKLTDSLSCKDVKINELDRKLMVIKTTKGHIKQINSLPNETFDCGDYVLYSDKIHLVTDVDEDDEVYTKGSMQLCNYTLKFQSPTGIILSYPCITDNRVQGTGDTDTKVMTLPAGRKIILLPHDENTTLLRNDRRLFVDLHPTNPRPYEIDFVDSTKFNYGDKGLLEIYVSEDQLQSDDRVDLGICNYFEPSVEPEPPVEGETYATIKVNGDLILGNSNYITLSPTFHNADGTVNETISAIWDYIYPLNNQSAFTIVTDGNNAKIKVADEMYELIGEKLIANVSDGNGGFIGVAELEITNGW